MAILGYDTAGAGAGSGISNGAIELTKFTLASAATMTELHCYAYGGTGVSASNDFRLVIYADSSGVPGARVAYSAVLSPPTTGTASMRDISETGFSVSLPAGDYWLGRHGIQNWDSFCTMAGEDTGAIDKRGTGKSDPPPDPFGSVASTGTQKHSVWAVITYDPIEGDATLTGTGSLTADGDVTTPGATIGEFTRLRLGTGLAGTDMGGGVIKIDATGEAVAEIVTVMVATWEGGLPEAVGEGQVWRVPYLAGAATSFDLERAFARIEETGAGDTEVVIESSPPGGAFTPTEVATLTIAASGYEDETVAALGTVDSGDLLRINWSELGADPAVIYTVELEGTEV